MPTMRLGVAAAAGAFFVLFLCFSLSAVPGVDGDRMVGGLTEVQDVKHDQQVQELGRFSVAEYNRRQDLAGEAAGGMLSFSEVVGAQRQVVTGIKYYMKIVAAEDGAARRFDAVVLVKPWLKSKELLDFEASRE